MSQTWKTTPVWPVLRKFSTGEWVVGFTLAWTCSSYGSARERRTPGSWKSGWGVSGGWGLGRLEIAAITAAEWATGGVRGTGCGWVLKSGKPNTPHVNRRWTSLPRKCQLLNSPWLTTAGFWISDGPVRRCRLVGRRSRTHVGLRWRFSRIIRVVIGVRWWRPVGQSEFCGAGQGILSAESWSSSYAPWGRLSSGCSAPWAAELRTSAVRRLPRRTATI